MADNNKKYISIINKGGNDIYIKDAEARQSIANKADNTPFGASGTNHSSGLVPDPGVSEGNTKFLREDGTWQTPPSGATYESKNASSGGTEVSLVTTGEKYIWNNKQDTISDLSTIRSGAAAGATAYQKPSTGIPASDIKSGVIPTKASLGLDNVDNTADADKSVNYATTAGSAPANGGNSSTVNGHTVNSDVPAGAVFTDTNTWRPLGTGADDACAGNDSRLSDSRPASDVYSWAKASTKPAYTKSEVGLGNVTNDAQVKRSEMGAASGVATLDSAGKVPSSQLPSYVDDVLEYDTKSGFPTTGEAGKIYVNKATNTTWRWSGSAYTQIKGDLAIGNTTGTAADGGIANTHYNNTSNPHSVTKAQVGLGSVVNTGDSATPVSGGTTKFTTGGAYTELNKKVDKVDGKGLSTNDYTTNEKNKLAGIAAGAEVNVQSDWNATSGDAVILNKPTIPAAVAVKGNAETSYRTGNVNITPANIGLGNVNNTADANKSVASAAKLTTARTLWGQSFDGTSNVTGSFWLGNSTDNRFYVRNTVSNEAHLHSGFLYDTGGKEAFVFCTGYSTGRIVFYNNTPLDLYTERDYVSKTPALCIYDGRVSINKLLPDANYNLDVDGTLNVSGDATLTSINGVTVGSSPKFTDTTYSAATTSAAGLMSADDKTKLNGIAAGATNVTTDTVSGWGYTKNAGTITGIKMNGASKGTSGVVDLGTVITAHQDISGKVDNTTTVNGHALSGNVSVTKSDVGLGNVGNFKAVSTVASQDLSDTEKANARANIGAGTSSFSGSYNDLSNKPTIPAAAANGTYTVKTLVGSTTTDVSDFTANQSSADDVTFVQGSNVTITPDVTNRKITIAATDTTYSEATTSAAGLMSSSDKGKLNGIESGAQTHKAPTTAEVKSALGTGSGTSKYLREDGTWQTPEGGIDYTTIDSDVADINASVAANALLKTAQSLTASEKTQVKTNLGIELAGTATGPIIAQSNTNYSTAQVRNIILSTSEPTSSDGNNGDIWIVYEA